MKFKIIITFFCFLSSLSVTAQDKYDYQWIAGYPPYKANSLYGAYKMDFNEDSLKFILEPKASLITYFSTASICNKNGKLVLYSNGCQIHNGNFELVEGCENINPGNAWDSGCSDIQDASYPSIQSEIFLPYPELENKYFYLAHKKDFSQQYFNDKYYTEFYQCNIIDMSLNDSLGKSIDNFAIEYPDVVKSYNLAACKNANGKDWWVINISFNSKKFYRILLTKDGISGPWEQNGGPPRDTFQTVGQSVFSPDGKKYACIYSSSGIAWVMDFNRQTGLFSNLQILNYETMKGWDFRGIAFSPNSKYIYVSAGYYLYQFDATTDSIQKSKLLIDENDGYALPGWPYYIPFGIAQLGPDGKIYIGQFAGSIRQWSIINNPDALGSGCNFKQHSLLFPGWSYATPPIQPNFRLGPDTTTSLKQIPKYRVEMKTWYNPSSKIIKCWVQHLSAEKDLYTISVYDITGRTLMSQKITNPQYQEDISLDGSSLVPGVYIVNLMDKGRVFVSGKVMVY